MTNMPGANHAYQLGKEHPTLGIGVHLTLTCGRPLLNSHHTIVDADGNFKKLHYYKQLFYVDPEEVYDEWKAQIEAFLASGLKPTHLDSHHHVNNLESILPIFKQLAKEYDLPVRNNFKQGETERFVTTDVFEYQPETLLADTEKILAHFEGVDVVEVMCHPA